MPGEENAVVNDPMKDHPFLLFGLVTVVALALWTIQFWKVPALECRKVFLMSHLIVTVSLLAASSIIACLLDIKMDFLSLTVRVLLIAPIAGLGVAYWREQ